MKIIVGLGNPGKQYQTTRHNVGYLVLAELANRFATGKPRARFHADVLEARLGVESVLLMCPTTYMNRSGLSVSEACRFYKIPNENALVVCDDINLPFGKIRMRPEGGAGGQKGLQDVIRVLGGEKVPRLRIGVSAPNSGIALADYVLAQFDEFEKKELPFVLKTAADAAALWATDGIDEAMNRFNAIR